MLEEMFIFGHLGIGSKLVSPAARRLPWLAVLAGTLLPDLIDKPLYYIQRWVPGLEIPLVTCTRTFAHTAGFTITLTAIAWARRSKLLAGLALGTVSHQILDITLDKILDASEPSALIAFLWPVFGPNRGRFTVAPFENLHEHLSLLGNSVVIGAEMVGLLLLVTQWRARRNVT